MANYSTTFNSDGTGSTLPTGWTARWNATGAWTRIDAGSGDIAVRRSTATAARSGASFDAVDSDGDRANAEVLVKVRTASVAASQTHCGAFVRGSGAAGAETGYAAAIYGPGLRLLKYDAGAFTILNTATALGIAANTWYWIRLRVNGTSQQARIWLDGDSEPGSWNVSGTDTAISAAGWCGLFGSFGSSTNQDWADAAVGTNGDTAAMSSGAQTVAIGQASEADTAQALTAIVASVAAIGQASEANTAQPIAARQLRAVGQASESNAAQPFAAVQRKAIGQATETDAAQSIAASQRKAIGQSVEVDAAQPVAYSAPGVVGQATETDAAQPFAARQARAIGQALESNAAQPITASTGTAVAIGLALEIDTAGAFAALGPIAIAIGQAQEVDLARAMTSIGGGASIDPATIRRVARSPALPRLARSPAPWRSTNGL